MAAPPRGNTGYSVYFITASTFQKQNLFQSERFSLPFIDTLLHYRLERKYLLHEFVVMPNHFHLLITPTPSLERSMQLIKGGFSYRARKGAWFRRRNLAAQLLGSPGPGGRRLLQFQTLHPAKSCEARFGQNAGAMSL